MQIFPYSSSYDEDYNETAIETLCNAGLNSDQRKIKAALPKLYQVLRIDKNSKTAEENKLANTIAQAQALLEQLRDQYVEVYRYRSKLIDKAVELFKNMLSNLSLDVEQLCYDSLLPFSNLVTHECNLKLVHQHLHVQINQWMPEDLFTYIWNHIQHHLSSWMNELKDGIVNYAKSLKGITEIEPMIDENIVVDELMNDLQQHFITARYIKSGVLNNPNIPSIALNNVGRILGQQSRFHSSALQVEQYRNYLVQNSFNEMACDYAHQYIRALVPFEKDLVDSLLKVSGHTETELINRINQHNRSISIFNNRLMQIEQDKSKNKDTFERIKLILRQIELDYSHTN